MPAMPTSVIGECQGYPKETLKNMAFQATRRVRVTWDDRYAWANYFLYTSAADLYPYFVNAGIPTQSSIVGMTILPDENTRLTHGSASTAQAVYTHALLGLTYQSAGFDLTQVVIEQLLPRNEMTYLHGTGLRFANGTPVQSVALYSPGYEYVLSYPRKTTFPSICSYTGVINLDVYMLKLIPTWIAPFCGLYAGAKVTSTWNWDGTQNMGVDHHILVRGADWNKEWNPVTGAWEYVYTASGAQISKHAMTGFSALIR